VSRFDINCQVCGKAGHGQHACPDWKPAEAGPFASDPVGKLAGAQQDNELTRLRHAVSALLNLWDDPHLNLDYKGDYEAFSAGIEAMRDAMKAKP
jgi:hypothetical protein